MLHSLGAGRLTQTNDLCSKFFTSGVGRSSQPRTVPTILIQALKLWASKPPVTFLTATQIPEAPGQGPHRDKEATKVAQSLSPYKGLATTLNAGFQCEAKCIKPRVGQHPAGNKSKPVRASLVSQYLNTRVVGALPLPTDGPGQRTTR